MKREGRSHSLWCNPSTGAAEAVPRHNEISSRLARKICRNPSVPEIGG
ncbi:MAG TPA: addiction module toxin, HicA family [Myxococcota bacterium]|nr:addiction module toxin, HicA family [Myxococcota bacterium]